MSRWVQVAVFGFILALFAVRNLPWHLDDYDQAKQAYTSFEMVERGAWWFQHTPTQNVATKPPLAGWLSAGVHRLTGWWEGAWRFPSLAAALVLLGCMIREGSRIDPRFGAMMAAGAFGLNAFAPRLATLARTDMLLALFIFLAGWLVYRNVREQQPWTRRDRWLLFAAVLAGTLTKGPILYAFLLPGLLIFGILCRRKRVPCHAWSGLWPWIAPLGFFAAWAIAGLLADPEFYEQVVRKEFFGRFISGERAVHKSQPIYFYVTNMLVRFSPWSVILAGLFSLRDVRRAIFANPHLLWLVCWAGGALLLMSLVPSKRADRIFPIVPPLALLVAGGFSVAPERLRFQRERIAQVTVAAAVLFSGVYTAANIIQGRRQNEGALVEFGSDVRRIAQTNGLRFGVVSGKDEGMLLYLRQIEFSKVDEAREKWSAGELDALVVPDRALDEAREKLPPFEVTAESAESPRKNSRYYFVRLPAPPAAISP